MGEKETWDEASNLNSSKSNRVAGEEGDIAIGEEGVQRSAGPRDRGEPAARATNLNSSRSNIYRTGAPADPDEPPEAAINTSHSNIKNLSAAEGGDDSADGEDAEAIRLNSSKSNAYREAPEPAGDAGSGERNAPKTRSNIQNNREAAPDPVGDDPEPAEGTIVKSKSNITNN